jgi:hypothetical protein
LGYGGSGDDIERGRTIPSFRIALAMEEKEEWKPFRNALDKSERKMFSEKSQDILILGLLACSCSC